MVELKGEFLCFYVLFFALFSLFLACLCFVLLPEDPAVEEVVVQRLVRSRFARSRSTRISTVTDSKVK